MAKKTNDQTARKLVGAKQDNTKIYVDELYFRHVDQEERWRQEYEHWQMLENKLLEISKLRYEEVDYAPQLVRTIFIERAIPDLSYMVENARVAAEAKFFNPIITHIIIIAVFIFVLIMSTSAVLLWFSGASVVIVMILLSLLLQHRHSFIQKAVLEKKQEVDRRITYEQNKIVEERKKHEESEDERIKIIEELLEGEVSSIFARIEYVLSKEKIPFYISMDIDLYANVPVVKIWLPHKEVIPAQTCTAKPSGRPVLDEKDMRVINRQYLELCAALMIKVASVIYGSIPNFDCGYLYGITKGAEGVDYLLAAKVDRQSLIAACDAPNGLAAMQRINGNFECNTAFELAPLEVNDPLEWGNIEHQLVRSLHLNLFKE